MFLRALLAFLALPGVLAFAVPLTIAHYFNQQWVVGLLGSAIFFCGLSGLMWCVWAFYVSGKGTLAPWAPTRNLVTHGLYRYSRNPMYCAVLLLLAGWALLFESSALAVYAVAVAIGFHARVVFGEELWLAKTHPDAWREYSSKVNRWIGKSGKPKQ
jgi:protein-S-isoprenylcysteine O-methyltransferase Ste14